MAGTISQVWERAIKALTVCDRCSEMNGDSPCHQGRQGVPAVPGSCRGNSKGEAGKVGRGRVRSVWRPRVLGCTGQAQREGAFWAPRGARPSLCRPASQAPPRSTWDFLSVGPSTSGSGELGRWLRRTAGLGKRSRGRWGPSRCLSGALTHQRWALGRWTRPGERLYLGGVHRLWRGIVGLGRR